MIWNLNDNQRELCTNIYAMRFACWKNAKWRRASWVTENNISRGIPAHWEILPENAQTRENKATVKEYFNHALENIKKHLKDFPDIKIILVDFDENLFPIILFQSNHPNKLNQLCLRALGSTDYVYDVYATTLRLDGCMLSI